MDFGLSDFDSSSESSGFEDQDDVEYLFGGRACSILSSLEETIYKIDDFLSFERTFLHEDVVCSVADTGKIGKVINVDMFVDLENIYGSKIQNVNSKNLQRLRSLSIGDCVLLGPWVGKVEKIVDRVIVLFDDGTKCEYTATDLERLVPVSPDIIDDSQYPFYPGQQVLIELVSVSKSMKWFCGASKDKRDHGTVISVEAGLVYVDWLGCATVNSANVRAPPCKQDSKNLIPLSCFSHTKWQLGDWCLLPASTCNNVIEQQCHLVPHAGGLIKREMQSRMICTRNLTPNFHEIAVIVETKTIVDVLWQDGSKSVGLDPCSLSPANVVDALEFWPEQFVLEKGACDSMHVPSIQRWGVVRCVDANERTVKVKWSDFANNAGIGYDGEQMEETVSAFELVEHPDYSFSLGDVVFLLEKTLMSEETDDQYGESDEDENQFTGSIYLSRIGTVVGFKDGNVEVQWASDATSMVAPFKIYRIDKCGGASAHDENIEQLYEEMTADDNQPLGEKRKDILNAEAYQTNLWDASSCFIPRVAVGVFSSVTSSLFASLSKSLLGSNKHKLEDGRLEVIDKQKETLELCDDGQPLMSCDLNIRGKINSEQSAQVAQGEQDIKLKKCPQYFSQFDVVSDCLDHHFVNASGKDLQLSQVRRSWLKRVQQEWIILEQDLPETIYVRVYEEQMNLLRAAIEGAPGTPYHDGLFFFDICFPPNYPNEPPMVYYNSGGLRLNPNLYESGKVCLSLLNTWSGSGSEVWNAGSSTILQVLLSLQALVLNEKPYFNEAGYDSQIGKADGEKNSISYNENAFLLSCQTMLYVLRRPPKHFEMLVEEHFRRNCSNILLACKAYMEGTLVGNAFGNTKAEQESRKGNSRGFKIMLGKLFPVLVQAFSDKGIDCSHFVGEVQ